MSQVHTTAIGPLVESFTLDNGLRVHALRRDFAPTITAYYHFAVGSANDPKGRSGIAHLLEHMMFKGTSRIGSVDAEREAVIMGQLSDLWHELQRELDRRDNPFEGGDEAKIAEIRARIDDLTGEQQELIVPNEYSELVSRAGGTGMNATTSNDVTRYFVQLPANQLELWFSLESQRLLHPVFREFYTERDVVLEERRLRTDNQPEGLVFEALRRLLYSAHPYGTPVIGWPRDIERLTREDARAYFRTWYSPGNCEMVVVGDVEPEEVHRLAQKYLGGWQPQDLPHLHMTAEPEGRGVRRQKITFDAEPQLRLTWVTVPEGHPDQYPLQLLSILLGELSSSRLNQRLVVERRVAAVAGSFHLAQKHSGSFNIVLRPRAGHGLEELEVAVLEELDRLAEEGVSERELERAQIALEAGRVRRQASNMSLAMDLGAALLASGSVDYLDEFEHRILAVEPEQLRAVAQRYLRTHDRVAVELQRDDDRPAVGGGAVAAAPESTEHPREVAPTSRGSLHSPGFDEMLRLIESAPGLEFHIPAVGKDVERIELDGGPTVFLKPSTSLPALTLSCAFTGGYNSAPVDRLATWQLASQLLTEGGAGPLDPSDLERRKEDLGLRMSIRMGPTESSAQMWSLQRNMVESLDLLTDLLRRSRLDENRLAVLAGKQCELMKRRADYPSWGIGYLGQKVLHGDDPRLGYQPTRAEIEALSPGDVREALERTLGPDNLYITACGDFDRDEMLGLLQERFGGWDPATHPERVWIDRTPTRRPGVHLLEKSLPQPAVRFLLELGVDRTAAYEEHAALEILNRILGGSGFRSRLMERLRSVEGLTYGVSSSLNHQGRPGVPGSLSISYQTRADAVARSIEIVLEECHQIRAEAVSEPEVVEQIQAWRNQFIFRFENEATAVTRLMHQELDDRPYDWDRQQLALIEQVTPQAVLDAAQRYLEVEDFTISVFGEIPASDADALDSRLGLTRWERDEVFAGGY